MQQTPHNPARERNEPEQGPPGGASRAYLHLSLTVALLIGVVVAAYALWSRTGEAPKEQAAEEILTQFARLHATDREAALRLLGPEMVFGPEPVSEAKAETYYADHLLRSPRLEVVKVLPGEPDGKVQKTSRGKFTLVTRSPIVRTPTLRVLRANGEVWGQDQQIMSPDIVVEVRDGKIVALRTELPLR